MVIVSDIIVKKIIRIGLEIYQIYIVRFLTDLSKSIYFLLGRLWRNSAFQTLQNKTHGIPIIMMTGKDDKGFWHQVEEYVRDHTKAEFSHGLCPTCMKKLYPVFEVYQEQ